jgi:hypothetical protein
VLVLCLLWRPFVQTPVLPSKKKKKKKKKAKKLTENKEGENRKKEDSKHSEFQSRVAGCV